MTQVENRRKIHYIPFLISYSGSFNAYILGPDGAVGPYCLRDGMLIPLDENATPNYFLSFFAELLHIFINEIKTNSFQVGFSISTKPTEGIGISGNFALIFKSLLISLYTSGYKSSLVFRSYLLEKDSAVFKSFDFKDEDDFKDGSNSTLSEFINLLFDNLSIRSMGVALIVTINISKIEDC